MLPRGGLPHRRRRSISAHAWPEATFSPPDPSSHWDGNASDSGREEENGPEGGRTRTPTPAARQQNINDGATRTRRLDIERRRGGGADVATCMEWAALGWVCRDFVLSFWFTHSLVYKGWLITDED